MRLLPAFGTASVAALLGCATIVHAQIYGAPTGYAAQASPNGCGSWGCGTPGPVGYGAGQEAQEAFPPNAAPGQCFTKVLVPERTETYTEQVEVSPAKAGITVVPGLVHHEQRSVLVKEAAEALTTIPATYRTVTETVVVNQAHTRTEVIPAVYDSVSEQVKVREGYTAWLPGSAVAGYAPGAANSYKPGQISKSDGLEGKGLVQHNPAYGGLPTKQLPTGEVLCLVEVPPEYKTITKQVLRTPARTVEVLVPAETRVITRQVVDQPARVERRAVPAVYDSVDIEAREPDARQAYRTPPTYDSYTRTRIVSPSRFEWKQVDCQTEVIHQASPPMAPTYYPAPLPQYGVPPGQGYRPPSAQYNAYPSYAPPAPCCRAPG
jgi:hypothetical protein